ncbi:hypothetical protein BASA50_006913 [Batrachochytrium salamandrivorans]|uniref:DUF952 domain-containing protein n=1 Tax=Batrachochytrium salamandrivorans TaxID=1357716 RepID=A0ABQ8FBB9_9FUNG|nr:hypothetical protein BASA60_005659 [Batrachochytrium salamandrivorans]KAH6594005.1 hypothetical protein BASA50_006913 [Batrachochytrium salamandrivorans]KAJ1344732.1 hypothetical protein BSLG_000255 [Batrachochytrium salamandrivorans]
MASTDPEQDVSVAYKILTTSEYEAIQPLISKAEGQSDHHISAPRWSGTALDLKDGFVHLSAPWQALATAKRFFGDVDSLVLLEIDLGQIAPGCLRWEVAAAVQRECIAASTLSATSSKDAVVAATFPHVYDGLDLAAVKQVIKVSRLAAGSDQHHAPTWDFVWPIATL